MKYGLICKVCDRLLWKGEKRISAGMSLQAADWRHAETGRRAAQDERLHWCGCKPTGWGLKQQELAEPR
jgi:hypothetical protein